MSISALYPGTFDPITNGHQDLIRRAASIFKRVLVAIAANPSKAPMFSLDERVELARAVLADIPNVEVRGYGGLTVQFAQDNGLSVMVRGLRAVSDFEYEFQMAGMNARLNPDIETVFLMASERCQFISSRFVKEIGRLGGNIDSFVPKGVKLALLEKFGLEA